MRLKLTLAALLILCAQALAFDSVNIAFSRPAGAPYFVGQPEFNLDAEEFTTLIVKMKAEKSGTARLFWATNFDPTMNGTKSIWFYLDRSQEFKEYVFNAKSQSSNWAGFVGQLLVYPENGVGGIEIQSARVITGNPIVNVKSGWREFWGPRGREVIGSSINLTSSSTFFGHPVNTYAYWIIALGLVFFMAINYYQNKRLLFDIPIKQAITLILTLWVLLALNSGFNYLKIFKLNISKYFGKSLEEKRAVAYGKDYYAFLAFAKDKLPPEPVKFGVVSSRFAPELQARIFLAPHVLITNPEIDYPYLLAFQPNPEQAKAAARYTLLAKLNENAYVMKRK